jgi:hypothetical protein
VPRQQIDTALPLHQKVDMAWAALVAANDAKRPQVLVRGSQLVSLGGVSKTHDFQVDSLRYELSRACQFTRATRNGVTDVDPPRDVAQALLNRDASKLPGAPRVERIVDVPVLGGGGELLAEPGFHAADQVYYEPGPGLAGVQPWPTDTVSDVVRARDFIVSELFGDFDFAEPADLAHALALLLLPFVREYIGEHPTPLHAVFAPDHGAGKTTLARAALIPGCGTVPVSPGSGSSDEEWRKVITATLLQGVPAVLFDNLAGTLDSPSLASALTTGFWSDRLLGKSRQLQLPVRNVWAATGNNIDLADEQVRRVVPVFIEPRGSVAAERSADEFRHPDLFGWAEKHRTDLVGAALALVKHWAAGESVPDASGTFQRMPDATPTITGRTLGSYTRWGQVIGGILADADVPGFLENREKLEVEANEEGREAAYFLQKWHEYTTAPVAMKQLVQHCTTPDNPLRDALPTPLAVVAGRADKLLDPLSTWLRDHNRRRMRGFQLVAEEGRPRKWRVRTLDA